jgi:regulator of replication initiation timing
MEPLTFLQNRLNLEHIKLRMQLSLDEIKQKRPDRLDYIKPMTESIYDLHKAIYFIQQIEELQKLFIKENHQLNIDLAKANLRLSGLEKQNQILLENATL